jgi:hypothetical protein
MSQPIDREGNFRAVIESYGVREMESGAVCVAIKAKLTQIWNGEVWESWEQYDMVAEGDIWIVKKDNGGLNSNGVESLIRHAGWDGSFESITDESWQPSPCQVQVQRDDYKGATRYRIAFVNDFNRTPGAMSTIDGNKAKELASRFGAQLRAIAGNAKRNVAPLPGKPVPPPPPKSIPGPVPVSANDGDPIPF